VRLSDWSPIGVRAARNGVNFFPREHQSEHHPLHHIRSSNVISPITRAQKYSAHDCTQTRGDTMIMIRFEQMCLRNKRVRVRDRPVKEGRGGSRRHQEPSAGNETSSRLFAFFARIARETRPVTRERFGTSRSAAGRGQESLPRRPSSSAARRSVAERRRPLRKSHAAAFHA
jgi:hypothetical protein